MWTFPVIDGAVAYGVYKAYQAYNNYNQSTFTDSHNSRSENTRMVIRKKYAKRLKKNYRRKPVGKVPVATKKYINKVLYKNIETKSYVVKNATNSKKALGLLYWEKPLEEATKGTSVGNYTGDQFMLRGFHLHYRWHNSADVTRYVRLLVLEDKMTFLEADLAQDFFVSREAVENDPANFNNFGSTDQIYFPINKQRFKVHLDRKFRLHPYSGSEVNNEVTFIKYLPIRRKVIKNDNNQSNPPVSPQIYVVYFIEGENNEAPAVEPPGALDPYSTHYIKVYYRDA